MTRKAVTLSYGASNWVQVKIRALKRRLGPSLMALQTPHDTPYSEPHRFGRARPASRPTVASRRPHPRREPTIRSIAARAARDRAPHGGGHAKRAARLRVEAEE